MDWTVPLALINLEKIIEPNWDLTMAKVAESVLQCVTSPANGFPPANRSVNI